MGGWERLLRECILPSDILSIFKRPYSVFGDDLLYVLIQRAPMSLGERDAD